MKAAAEKCRCCGAECGGVAVFVAALGALCGDCEEGARHGTRILRREGVCGIFLGACGDNDGNGGGK